MDFRGPRQGVVVGGDYTDETNGERAAAWTGDDGHAWHPSRRQVGGYRSGRCPAVSRVSRSAAGG